MKVIVGLGNPGSEYENTRHNLGFRAVQYFAQTLGCQFLPSRRCKGLESSVEIDGIKVYSLLPLTFMNLSGRAVGLFLESVGAAPSDALVVYDDFHLSFGQIRLRKNGSDGGHNGLSSVIETLGTEDFPRLRLGIGEPKGKTDPADFVLSAFDAQEQKELEIFIPDAVACCRAWVTGEIDQVMSQFNKRKGNG